jgi:hypothetical protein
MPVKERIAKDRRPVFSAEAVELFAELERRSDGYRPYTEGSRRLAAMLGLVDEWIVSCHVNDRSSAPCHPPGYLAYDAWFRCRAVRFILLEAARERAQAYKLAAATTEPAQEPPPAA